MKLFQPDPLPGTLGHPVPANLWELLVGAARRGGGVPRVVIDGPSGSGTTTLAIELARLLNAELLSLDDVYPGWEGLTRASSDTAQLLLEPLSRTVTGRMRLWDWERGTPGDWRVFAPDRALVIEGAGALTRQTARYVTLGVWLELEQEDERKRRVLTRSGGDLFAPHWESWARQEREHMRSEQPRALADAVLSPALAHTDPVYTLVGGALSLR